VGGGVEKENHAWLAAVEKRGTTTFKIDGRRFKKKTAKRDDRGGKKTTKSAGPESLGGGGIRWVPWQSLNVRVLGKRRT